MGTGSSRARRLGIALAFGAVVALPLEAFAQVEEIVVTTRKREESLQQVPIAVDAFTADVIERKGIVSLDDVVAQSSSVILDRGFSPQDQRITIRGLSPTRGRQNVAVLQDGIDISSEAISTAGGSLLINPRLFDLERIEIVKGPQNALYGRSAFAGAINYITKKPGDTLEGRVGTDIGSEGQLEVSGNLSGPLTDTLSAGVTGMVWSRDGDYQSARTGADMGDTQGLSLAGTLVWRPTDNFSATARVENLDDEFGITPFAVMPFNATFDVPQSAIDAGVVTQTQVVGVRGDALDGDDLKRVTDTSGTTILNPKMGENPRTCIDPGQPNSPANNCSDYQGTERDITRATLTLDWDLGPVVLTSLTHYADTDTSQEEGPEDVSAMTNPTPSELFFDNETDLFSQEIRLASNTDGAISWVVGGLYWNEDTHFDDGSYTCLNYDGVFTGFPNGPQPCGTFIANIVDRSKADFESGAVSSQRVPLNADPWDRETEHWSVYGLVEWQLPWVVKGLSITLEGRYTDEELDVTGPAEDNGIWDPSGNLCLLFGVGFACPQLGPGTYAPGVFGPEAVTFWSVDNVGSATEDDDFFAPKATVSWTPGENQLFYLSYARAYKPKGISLLLGGTGAFYDDECGTASKPDCVDPVANFRFDQEKLDVYELGWKTSWLDNALRLNGAVFYQDFLNKQVSTQVTDPDTGILSPRILNAGEAEVWGLELDVLWLPTENLSLNLSYTWLDTEYTDFKSNTTGVGTIAYVGNCTPRVEAGRTVCEVSYDGNELEDAPEHALVGGARYQDTLAGGTSWFIEGDFEFQDDRYEGADNALVLPSYWLWNFRLGLMTENIDVVAYVDNAFDDDTVKTGFSDGDIPFFYATGAFLNHGTLYMPDPRTYGLRVSYRFGE